MPSRSGPVEVGRQVGELLVEQAEERAEGLFVAAVRRGGDQDQVPRLVLGDAPQQLEALLAPAPDAAGQRAAVGLVHDDELGALADEVLGPARGLDEVGGDDGEAVAVEDRHADRQVALQALDRAAQDQLGLDVELLGQLALPLLGQVRRAEHGEPPDLAPVQAARGR